ncbi:hypothetical protein BJF81_13240 [Ornithinimicrobium sp. CNJ-824]|nr:hypothetical protein BJF81_13240 [Ornithinimicrobium sp. CNJ-824]
MTRVGVVLLLVSLVVTLVAGLATRNLVKNLRDNSAELLDGTAAVPLSQGDQRSLYVTGGLVAPGEIVPTPVEDIRCTVDGPEGEVPVAHLSDEGQRVGVDNPLARFQVVGSFRADSSGEHTIDCSGLGVVVAPEVSPADGLLRVGGLMLGSLGVFGGATLALIGGVLLLVVRHGTDEEDDDGQDLDVSAQPPSEGADEWWEEETASPAAVPDGVEGPGDVAADVPEAAGPVDFDVVTEDDYVDLTDEELAALSDEEIAQLVESGAWSSSTRTARSCTIPPSTGMTAARSGGTPTADPDPGGRPSPGFVRGLPWTAQRRHHGSQRHRRTVAPVVLLRGGPMFRRMATAAAALTLAVPLAALPAVAGPPDGKGPPQERPDTSSRSVQWYLALGDSLAAGYQPGMGDDLDGGYVGHVLDGLRDNYAKTKLVNLACSGETSDTMIDGGRCSYPHGSQLDAAEQFLRAHKDKVSTVTIDIGANDVAGCVSAYLGDPTIDLQQCIDDGLGSVGTNLPLILDRLRAASPEADIAINTYYNPFVIDEALAAMTALPAASLNQHIETAALMWNVDVAEVAAAFGSDDQAICLLTWMCAARDIHPKDAGYEVMGDAFLEALGLPVE